MDNAWKKFERRIGKILGLPKGNQRTGPTGLMGFDVVAPHELNVARHRLGVEAKHTTGSLPKYLSETIEQSRQAKKYHVEQEVIGNSMPPMNYFDYDAICVYSDNGRKEEDILCVLPLVEYVALRRKAAAWEQDLKDIQGCLKMDCSRNEVSLCQWREFYDFISRIFDRRLKRGY